MEDNPRAERDNGQGKRAQEPRAQKAQEEMSQLLKMHTQDTIRIRFKIQEDYAWKDVECLDVGHSDPSEVAQAVKRYIGRGLRSLNWNTPLLGPDGCFKGVALLDCELPAFSPGTRVAENGEVILPGSRNHVEKATTSLTGGFNTVESLT